MNADSLIKLIFSIFDTFIPLPNASILVLGLSLYEEVIDATMLYEFHL